MDMVSVVLQIQRSKSICADIPLILERADYNPNLLDRLKNAEDVDTAATAFMREYEKCANQSTQQKLRTTAAEQIYNVMELYDSPVDVE